MTPFNANFHRTTLMLMCICYINMYSLMPINNDMPINDADLRIMIC